MLRLTRGTAQYRFMERAHLFMIGRVASVAIVLAMVATACAGNQNSPNESGPKSTLTVGVASLPASLDPGPGGSWVVLFSLTHSTLLTLNKDGSVGPGLAASYRYVGMGNQTFELTLHPDRRFSDGGLVTAAAVKTWLEYLAKSPSFPNRNQIAFQSVIAADQWTVRIELASPNPIMPYLLASTGAGWGAVSSPESVQNPKAEGKMGPSTVGAGPYAVDLSSTVAGDHFTLLPNKHYSDQSGIHFSKIVLKAIKNPTSMLQALQAGQIDIAEGDTSTAEAAERSGFTVSAAPTLYTGIFFLDRGGVLNKPLADVRVRQALNYAVNRKEINAAINGKYGVVTDVLTTLDGKASSDQNYYTYDPAKARSLLAQAGYPNGFELAVLCSTVFPYGAKLCQAVAQDFKAVGVELQLTTPSSPAEVAQGRASGKYPAFVTQWSIFPMWLSYSVHLSPGGLTNQHGWTDPVLEKLWQQATVADSQADTYWPEMIRRVTEEADFLPLFNTPWFFYYRADRIGGVNLSGPVDYARSVATEWFSK